MTSFLRCALAGAALAVACFFGPIGQLVSPAHLWVYHLDGSIWTIVLPLALDLVLVWIGCTVLLNLACRKAGFGALLFPGLVLLLPCLMLAEVRRLNGWKTPRHALVAVLALALTAWIAWIWSWRSMPRSSQRLGEVMISILGFGGIAAVLVAGEVFWFAWQARALNQTVPSLHVSARQSPIPGRPRVIWVLLDELSQQQVYDHRFGGLNLPEFDRLASQSVVFTNVTAAAIYTDLAVPLMMTGAHAQAMRSTADGSRIELGDGRGGAWRPFRAEDTIFADALKLGYRTAVAGWYNPYCRLLGSVLDTCRWEFREDLVGGMDPHGNLPNNMAGPVHTLTDRVLGARTHPHGTLPRDLMRTRITDYWMLQADTDRILTDPSLDLVFLHLPVPHPPGFYDRRTGQFTAQLGSYIDNLALADSTLAHIRQVLASRGEWDSSAVLVMGDHSWRTSLIWKDDPAWTAEDEVASGRGGFDPRPAYILKLPHQNVAARIDTHFSALETRALLDQLLERRLNSPDEVSRFAADAH